MNKYEVKKALEYCSAVGFEPACNYCAYCYRCNDLPRDALDLITEQEKEIEQLTRECNQQADVGRLNLARKLKGNGHGNRKSERD